MRMIIGIPKEIKEDEYRVGATPAMVKTLVEAGHRVYLQATAGEKIGFTDQLYADAGAKILATAKEVYAAEMIIKVEKPQEAEFSLLREDQILFCFLHLAADPEQTKHLLASKVVGIAYEAVTDARHALPLLTPMSEIAGRLAIQAGATALQLNHGGKGLLLGSIPGIAPAQVVVIGGGTAGTEAARLALGLGADVTLLDSDMNRLRQLNTLYGSHLKTIYSTPSSIEESVLSADLVIGAVHTPGKTTPRLIKRKTVKRMTPGSVLVDISINQGGCSETSRPTTLSNPTYREEGVIHYCVPNMTAACAHTATLALTNATIDYALMIASKGYKRALMEHGGLRNGLNICRGLVTNEHVAHALGTHYHAPEHFLAGLACKACC